ncbi:dihydropteroate synthase [Kordiimonas sediminis]|uniref:Dihydropteroate synthase n=1 Tax=Kordiimonas sediminis TaxID=1735581 RepID=A0A919AS24_9PROT|nr:dihydropteroate synthase [Kordiimonas sediminis]GHF23342.1 dihydropteroate synthase [Kordiimonas sediminis]
MTFDLPSLSDGAKGYLLPVGSFMGSAAGLRLGNSGLKFAGVRLIIREEQTRVVNHYIPAGDIDSVLGMLPAPLQKSLCAQKSAIETPRQPIECAGLGLGRMLAFTRPLIMGVLNVTPDSFSDGGDFIDPDAAVRRARQMVAEGADIIDIGGESTRPGAKPVWEGEEANRILPVIAALAGEGVPISVDTRHSTVMQQALDAGAHILNDVSALEYDGASMDVAVRSGAPVVLMHSQGLPETMQDNPTYSDALLEVYDYLEARRDAAIAAGISQDKIILDPGIGFGKRVLVDNLSLINGLAMLHGLGCPVLLGASRKRFIEAITGVEDAKDRMPGSVAAALVARTVGVQVFRVHDVAETVQAMKVHQALADVSMMDVYD